MTCVGFDAQNVELCSEKVHAKYRKVGHDLARVIKVDADDKVCLKHFNFFKVSKLDISSKTCSFHLITEEHQGTLKKCPTRIYSVLDDVNKHLPNYIPGLYWCSLCKNRYDQIYMDHRNYIKPNKRKREGVSFQILVFFKMLFQIFSKGI